MKTDICKCAEWLCKSVSADSVKLRFLGYEKDKFICCLDEISLDNCRVYLHFGNAEDRICWFVSRSTLLSFPIASFSHLNIQKGDVNKSHSIVLFVYFYCLHVVKWWNFEEYTCIITVSQNDWQNGTTCIALFAATFISLKKSCNSKLLVNRQAMQLIS